MYGTEKARTTGTAQGIPAYVRARACMYERMRTIKAGAFSKVHSALNLDGSSVYPQIHERTLRTYGSQSLDVDVCCRTRRVESKISRIKTTEIVPAFSDDLDIFLSKSATFSVVFGTYKREDGSSEKLANGQFFYQFVT